MTDFTVVVEVEEVVTPTGFIEDKTSDCLSSMSVSTEPGVVAAVISGLVVEREDSPPFSSSSPSLLVARLVNSVQEVKTLRSAPVVAG